MNVIPLRYLTYSERGTCGLHPLPADVREPAIVLLGYLRENLDSFRRHPLLENSFHPQLHTLFGTLGMREDIELFLTDGIEDEIGYLGGW